MNNYRQIIIENNGSRLVIENNQYVYRMSLISDSDVFTIKKENENEFNSFLAFMEQLLGRELSKEYKIKGLRLISDENSSSLRFDINEGIDIIFDEEKSITISKILNDEKEYDIFDSLVDNLSLSFGEELIHHFDEYETVSDLRLRLK